MTTRTCRALDFIPTHSRTACRKSIIFLRTLTSRARYTILWSDRTVIERSPMSPRLRALWSAYAFCLLALVRPASAEDAPSKPPIDPEKARLKPKDGVIFGPGVSIDLAKQLKAAGG